MLRSIVSFAFTLSISCGNAANVAIIESYHAEYPWDQGYVSGIQDVLTTHTLKRFEMDTKRISGQKFADAAATVWVELQEFKPDLVIIGDDNAFKLLSKNLIVLNVPVVFLGLNGMARDYNFKEFSAITGVFERPLLKRSALLVRNLLGINAPKILIMFDASTTASAAHEYLSSQEPNIKLGKTSIDIIRDNHSSTWRNRIVSAKTDGYDAIIVGLYHTLHEQNGDYTEPDEMLAWINAHSPVPHFGFWNFSIGAKGNIGGFCLDAYSHGKKAAKLAAKILNGTPASKLYPVIDDEGMFIFSRSGMERWNLKPQKNLNAAGVWID